MEEPKVHILMSTYNGHKFLREQLDSIFKQTYNNFTLYVRDDGSNDGTNELLEEYIKEHQLGEDKVIIVKNKEKKNLGWKGNFWKLLDKCPDADYYAFCDQDDVWQPCKLEYAVEMLEKNKYQDLPVMYFSSYDYCDEKLRVLHSAPVPPKIIKLRQVMFYTPALGFSIVINHKLREIALQTLDRTNLAHDGWVQKIAAAMGIIVYDSRRTALYRRYSSAVTSGNKNIFSIVKCWIKDEIFGEVMKNEFHFSNSRFYQEYQKYLSADDCKMLYLFAMKKNNIGLWFSRLFYMKRFRPTWSGELALRICLLLNRY